jgi:lactoylglutathione lyase
MKIDHIGIWVQDLELMKEFYTRYFSGGAGKIYENHAKGFKSYFIHFYDSTRLELMKRSDIPEKSGSEETQGFAHVAINVGSQTQVDHLTEQLRTDGYLIISEPRTTGDGYYESVISDPEGNRLEIIC